MQTKTLGTQAEQTIIQSNIALLRANFERKPVEIKGLVRAKDKVRKVFESLPELGEEWAPAYLDFVNNQGIHPKKVRVWAVGGALKPEKPFTLRYKSGGIYYSDFDIGFSIDRSGEPLYGEEVLVIMDAARKETKDLAQLAESLRGLALKEQVMVLKNRPSDQECDALISARPKLLKKVITIAESKGIEDAECCIDIADVGTWTLGFGTPHALIGVAESKGTGICPKTLESPEATFSSPTLSQASRS